MSNEPAGATGEARKAPPPGEVLSELLRLMEFPVRFEMKELVYGNLSIALYPEGEIAGFAAGKRSPALEALQFLVNKVVNPPTGPRRWISLGVGDFPPARTPAAPAQRAPAPAAAPAPAPAPAAPPPPPPVRFVPPDEESLEVTSDAGMTATGRKLAEKSASLGRFYAVLGLSMEDRARLLQASRPVSGVTVSAEGEGRNRRLVFRPERPAPTTKAVPDDEDE